MSLYKRGETWHLNVRTPDGRRIRRSTGTTDKKRAQEYHDQLKVELWRVHKLGEKPRRTWQQASVRWLQEKQYKRDIAGDKGILRWLDPYFGDKYLDEITRDLIDEAAAIKLEAVTPSRVNKFLALIRSILRKACLDWEWTDKYPRVHLFPEPKQRVRFLTHEEAVRLLTELPDHLADMAEFSLATGLRQKNVRLLEWNHVSMEREMAWVDAWASWHVQSGTSLQELKELGGWSCFEMVLRYAHLGGDHLKDAANRISVTNWSQKTEGRKLKVVVSN